MWKLLCSAVARLPRRHDPRTLFAFTFGFGWDGGGVEKVQAGLVASMKSKALILLLGMLSVCGWTQEGTGIMYNDGKGGVKDQKEAISTLTKSSEQGDPYAQYILGGCYMVGQGVDKNEREAVDLWTKSASQGNADAQCILGICYNEGKGVVKNQGEAIKLWTKSAAQGNRRAKEELEKIKLK